MSATDEFGTETDMAEQLYGALVDISDTFAYQLEVAQTGYRHFQGYLELTNKQRHTWIQNYLAKHGLHFEYLMAAKGTPKQAWGYATKEETRADGPWTAGEPRHNEKANKCDLFVKAVKMGASDQELCDSYPSMMVIHSRAVDRVRQIYSIPTPEPIRKTDLELFLFYGPSGTAFFRVSEYVI